MSDDQFDGIAIEDLPSICAVTGFFVMNVGAMERMLFTISVTLGIETSFAVAEKRRMATVNRRLREIAPKLPEGDDFLRHLATAADILELRHAVVHGFVRYDDETEVFRSHRPRRDAELGGQVDPENAIWRSRRFGAADLMEQAYAARAITGFVIDRQVLWHEALEG